MFNNVASHHVAIIADNVFSTLFFLF